MIKNDCNPFNGTLMPCHIDVVVKDRVPSVEAPQGFPGHPGLPAHAPEGCCLCVQWESGRRVTAWFPGSLTGVFFFCDFP